MSRSHRLLMLENLESRQFLARDTAAALVVHNAQDPFDVDYSGKSTAQDALLIANYLNGATTLPRGALDVDGNGTVNRLDLKAVVDHLNRSTDQSSLVTFTAQSRSAVDSTIATQRSQGAKKPPYQYAVVGNSADAPVSPTSSGLALVGGGIDVDEVFRWMGQKANGGDFLVIRATGTDAYNKYIDTLVPSLDSVATLIIPSLAAANDPFVAQTIRSAEAVFIAGGDQADYVNFWKDTPVEAALYDALARDVPIGGTSAGLAVLGDIDYSATNGSITSSEALANPYDSRITLDTGLISERDYAASHSGSSILSWVNTVITDSHFQQRDRLGRLVTFMARADSDGLVPATARGIGINEQTALLIEPSGLAHVVGNAYARKPATSEQQRSVYFLDTDTVATNPLSTPLDFPGVRVVRATYDPLTNTGDTFDLGAWLGTHVDSYTVSASGGTLSSTQLGGGIY